MTAIGLDIGTTKICAVAIDSESGCLLGGVSRDNEFITTDKNYERCQNTDKIYGICVEMVEELCERFAPVCAIGITGQMHGIVYLDADGRALSNLYTWQDMTANEEYRGTTYAANLQSLTGYKAAAGFGCSTYYAHNLKGEVPSGTASICTVHDYVGMKLCNNTKPIMHTSDAASFGLFNNDTLAFDLTAAKNAGLDPDVFPDVCAGSEIIGKYNGIPVSVAIGDNQASFIGSVSDMKNSVLVNIGTGSQISFLTTDKTEVRGTELRPCHNDSFLRVGSSLCGGRAFAKAEEFFRQSAKMLGLEIKSAYPFIDEYLKACAIPENPLDVSTCFDGTRDEPEKRGYIKNIGLDNFTPAHILHGVMQGIVNELKSMYDPCNVSHTKLVGSGNGIRNNSSLAARFTDTFDMPLSIPSHKEEAAFGAVLYALTACGKFDTLAEAQKLIKYSASVAKIGIPLKK